MTSSQTAHRSFLTVAALLLASSAAVTITWGLSMSSMAGMPMPGGWTMSMTWMHMPGQTWPAAAASFLAMWVVMMVAMMLPALLPMLQRYRDAVAQSAESSTESRAARAVASRLGPLTALVGVGYFAVWTAVGVIAFPIGVELAAIEMAHPAVSRVVPIAMGVVILVAGALQFTSWKARQLACCRNAHAHGQTLAADAITAVRHGVRLGVQCGHCCANLMAILLVLGVMDLRAMAVITIAITLERLTPMGTSERIARATGVLAVATAMLVIARAVGL